MAKKKGNPAVKAPEDTKMTDHEIISEMERSYIDYSMSVITGRALPDVRDGLKPVQRRILYGMHHLGVTPDKPHKKVARIVGEVMGKFHPHGDSSIADALVRMAQDFTLRNPLVDGHGNFGSIDGDGAAAMRYIEARMSPFSLLMVQDIGKNTVDFVPNFDGEEMEPAVLPSRFPNILVNGSAGIAVGMATNIPPHNLGECVDACCELIENPNAEVSDLMKKLKAPDFPTGGIIMGLDGVRDMYRTGRGSFLVRAKTEIEPVGRGKYAIIVTEIPYQVNKAKLIERIAELTKQKSIDGIQDIRDESSREGLRIVIEVKRDTDPNIVLNNLLKQTDLQTRFSADLLVLANGVPKTLNLKDLLTEYLNFQGEVVERRTRYDLAQAEARKHILEGLLLALANIDEVIHIIRESTNDAKERLQKRFGLSEVQAKAILDMRLARLQKLEHEKLEAEAKELDTAIQNYRKILSSPAEIMRVVESELLEIKKNWKEKRRTAIERGDDGELAESDLIEVKELTVAVTENGTLKRFTGDTDAEKISKIEEADAPITQIFPALSTDYLLFFTDAGKAYQCRAAEIPDTRSWKGTPIKEMIPSITTRETVLSAMNAKDFSEAEGYLVFLTKNGTVKKMELGALKTGRSTGLVCISVKENDALQQILKIRKGSDLFLLSKEGKGIRFSESEISTMGRTASGVRGMKLEEGDEAALLCELTPGETIAVISEYGYAKKLHENEINPQARGGKGVFVSPKSKRAKTGKMAVLLPVQEGDVLRLATEDGTMECSEEKLKELSMQDPMKRIWGFPETAVYRGMNAGVESPKTEE